MGRKVEGQADGGGTGSREQGGFALLVALLALVALTALSTAGFVLAETDLDVSENHRSSLTTFYTADAGQSQYMAENGVPRPSDVYTYGGGTATVATRRLINMPTGMSVYHVSTRALRTDPGGGISRRAIGTAAVFTPFPMTVLGAFVAANGLKKNGVSGTIDGNDYAPPTACPYGILDGGQPPVAGVTVPAGGYTQEGGGGQEVPEGDPPVADTLATDYDVAEATGIDWAALVNETKVTPHYRYPEQPWPDFDVLPESEWPVIHVTSQHLDLGPAFSGRGTIILDGNVSFNGNFQWDGIILAGGRIVSDGNQTISGTIMTGLNVALGQNVPESSAVGNGQKSFLYHSCNVEAAARAMGWLAQVPGTWYETL